MRERRIQYPIGALSTLSFAWLFYEFDLKASALLNLYLTFQLIVGWWRWRKDSNARPVTRLIDTPWQIPLYVLATAAFYLVGLWLDKLAGGTQAWTDVVIFTASILAQWLLDFKKLGNWIVWGAVNVFAIITYFNTGLYITGFQFIFLFANVFYGYYVWHKSYKRSLSIPRLRVEPGARVRFIGDPPVMRYAHELTEKPIHGTVTP